MPLPLTLLDFVSAQPPQELTPDEKRMVLLFDPKAATGPNHVLSLDLAGSKEVLVGVIIRNSIWVHFLGVIS